MTVTPRPNGSSTSGRLLDIIRSNGPISRVEIAKRMALTPAAISVIVRSLLNQGLVEEVGHAASSGGKRRTLLEITANARYGVGVHLSAEEITYVVSNMAGEVVGRQCVTRNQTLSAEQTVEKIGRDLESLLLMLDIPRAGVVGVGIVTPGPIDYPAGRVFTGPTSPDDWSSFPLRDALSERLGLPVVVDKDATAAAIGEFWGGRVNVPLSFACLYMGRGIGSGIVVNGLAFRGSTSNAGEIGHVSLDVHGENCRCGNRGCLELFAAPSVVVRNAANRGMNLSGIQSEARLFDEICRRAANRDDALALELVRESAEYIAEGVLTLVNITDLDLVVLAGPGFAVAGAIYVETIRTKLRRQSFARRAHSIDVRASTNPRDAAAVGASALVLQQILSPRQ